MSAGAFEVSKYEANDGSIYPIRLQPETLSLEIDSTANAAPAGAVDQPTFAKVSRANGAYGVRPRKVSVRFTGTPPTGYKADQSYTIPVMTETVYDLALPATTGTYLGVACVVISRTAESVR